MVAIALAEKRLVPDWAIRTGIRRLLRSRLLASEEARAGLREDAIRRFSERLRAEPLAVEVVAANEQHYEVPARFFEHVLGPRMKYSCGLWPEEKTSLAEAEEAMLELTCARAEIEDGMRVLDLGCGWGSLALWIAQRYPRCSVFAVSNSHGQRSFIESRADALGLKNVVVRTCNVAELQMPFQCDRIVSIEMFEHMRNYELLLRKLSSWLTPQGKLFAHIFCHRHLAYRFEDRGKDDWMSRHFFTGGLMPSADLLLQFQDDLECEELWTVPGTHYARTCEAWLANLDDRYEAVLQCLTSADGPKPAVTAQRWRIFFMACAELFAYNSGQEWFVSHYRFRRR